MYFDINQKLSSGKNTQKLNKEKKLGFVKLGVRWAEQDSRGKKKENALSEINPTNCVKHKSVRVVFEHYICCVNWCSILFIVMMTLGH